jgi:hypothetical protein
LLNHKAKKVLDKQQIGCKMTVVWVLTQFKGCSMLSPIPDYYMYYGLDAEFEEVGIMSSIGYLSDADALAFCQENSSVLSAVSVEWVRYSFQGQVEIFVTCFRVPRVVSSAAVVSGVPSKSKRMLAVGKLIQGRLFYA